MKKKIVVLLIFLLVIAVAGIVVIAGGKKGEENVAELEKEINANIEVKTYKKTIPLYKRLINADPENIKWYTGLLEAYENVSQYGNYLSTCKEIIEKFPDNETGYIHLFSYYAQTGKWQNILTEYGQLPDAIKGNEKILEIYGKYHWKTRYVTGSLEEAGPFSVSSYLVKEDGRYRFLDVNCDQFASKQFDYASPFFESLAGVCKDGEWFLIDIEGDRVYAPKEQYEYLGSYREGVCLAKIDGKYGFVDLGFNKYAFDLGLDDASVMFNGVAAVCKNGKWGLINKQYETVLPFEYDDVVRDSSNIASRKGLIFLKKNDKYILYNSTSGEFVDGKYDDARLFYSEFAPVCNNGLWGFIDYTGKLVVDYQFEDASSSALRLFAVKKDGFWGMVDKNGAVVVDFVYNYCSITKDNGIFCVKNGDRYRFLKFVAYD